MSFRGRDDLDRKNKHLLFNLFWSIGFTPRLEIPIFEFMGDEKFGSEITDLDVFGWKYIPCVGILKLTGSAKGEAKNVSHKTEILKLKGVNNYFKPIQSFYIHDSSPTDELYWFAKKLSIDILSKASIISMNNRIEKKLEITDIGAKSLMKAIIRAKKLNKYDFLTSQVWITKNPDKIYKLEGLLNESIKDFKDLDVKFNLIFVLYIISTYIISIVEILEQIHNSTIKDYSFKLKLAMYGGDDTFKTVVDLIDGFNLLLKNQYNEVNNLYKYESFIPRFEKHSDLIKHFFINVEIIFDAIRILDYIIFTYAEKDDLIDINNILDDFIDSKKKQEKLLGFFRHLFEYFKQNINQNYDTVAKKLNILR